MVELFWICGWFSLLMAGQTSAPAVGTSWMEDYSRGLRHELDGELQEAVAAYRRVVVSRAPEIYCQQARYRCANSLQQLGRGEQANVMFESLIRELPPDSPLTAHIRSRLAKTDTSDSKRILYWQGELEATIKGSDLNRLREAAEALACAKGQDGVNSLVEAYKRLAVSHPARPSLLEFIARAEWPDAVPLLRAALQDKTPSVVTAATVGLGRMGDAESIPRMIELLSASESSIRKAAVEALTQLRSTESVQSLIHIAQTDKDLDLRRQALGAIRFIGTTAGLDAAASMPEDEKPLDDASERICQFSKWYRRSIGEATIHQPGLLPRSHRLSVNDAPRVGVVVSTMTHHAPLCRGLVMPYVAQIRKAWALQRAGFDVCLLAEAEAIGDPEATRLLNCLQPPAIMYPLGTWPACDVIIMDQIYQLSTGMVRTLAAYCRAGGSLIVCGASGGAYCGDGVTWRQLLQVRHLQAHKLSAEVAELVINAASSGMPLLINNPSEWAGPRQGSFFARETLGGQVLAEHEAPPSWAIKINEYGAGRVLCFNWNIGLSLKGTHDEDELLCRGIDYLLEQDAAVSTSTSSTSQPSSLDSSQNPLFKMMQHARWGQWSQARESLTPERLRTLTFNQKYDAAMQLANIYKMENNVLAGRAACKRLFGGDGWASLANGIDRLMRFPRHLQMSLVVGKRFPWWLDVPSWQRLPRLDSKGGGTIGEVPLWLASPTELPVVIRIRIGVVPGSAATLKLSMRGADLATSGEVRDSGRSESKPSDTFSVIQTLVYDAQQAEDGWFEFQVNMREWDASLGVEVMDNRS